MIFLKSKQMVIHFYKNLIQFLKNDKPGNVMQIYEYFLSIQNFYKV